MIQKEKRSLGDTIYILFCIFTAILIPCLYIFQMFLLYGLDNHLYEATGSPFDLKFYSEQDVLPIITLINTIEMNRKLEIFYIIILFLSYHLSQIIDIIKMDKGEKKWLNAIYIIIIALVFTISIFIVYTNLQYFSGTIMVRYNTVFYILYATLCNIIGLCFCVLLWSKFFDDIISVCKIAVSKIRGR